MVPLSACAQMMKITPPYTGSGALHGVSHKMQSLSLLPGPLCVNRSFFRTSGTTSFKKISSNSWLLRPSANMNALMYFDLSAKVVMVLLMGGAAPLLLTEALELG